MTLLMLFALVAGAGTALSPCVLPVLPAVLSAGATGGRRRPPNGNVRFVHFGEGEYETTEAAIRLRAGRHTLTLQFEPGISGYAFTFG